MGWGIWPKEYSPEPCARCGKSVKAGDKYYIVGAKDGRAIPAHASCEWEQADKEREQ